MAAWAPLASSSGSIRKVPAARYVDPAFLALEQERVFGRAWIAVGQTRRVAQPGQYFCVDSLPEPIIVIRDGGGTLRAFLNSCRHRGTRLLDGSGSLKAIRCPYHDWKYSLDGRLRHIPAVEGFAEPMERGALGLNPVRIAEWAGFCWVTLDDSAPPLLETLGGLDSELAPYALEDMVPVQETTWTEPCNWKAVLDNATESYHLPIVHAGSVNKHVRHVPQFDTYDDHYRLTLPIADYGWRNRLDAATSRGGPYTEYQRSALHKYVIFPNFLMNVLPCHLTVFQVWPDGPESCRFFYGFYARRGARGVEWARAHATWAASRFILWEDLKILRRFQAGVHAGRGNQHRFHDGEIAIAHFHSVLSRWIGAEHP